MKFSSFVAMVLMCAGCASATADVPAWRQHYLQRYPLSDVYNKLVNDHGDGFEDLYGVRNLREVIPGLIYRGGANNLYNKYGKRKNNNPLPTAGIKNLCEEGFGNSVYLYSTNYDTAPHQMNCDSTRGGKGHLEYLQHSPLLSKSAVDTIVKLAYETINGRTNGPLYLHCWNGWHASGFISAVILKQFCGFNNQQALDYWNKNTDGNNGKEYDKLRANLAAYVPDPALTIDSKVQTQICPRP